MGNVNNAEVNMEEIYPDWVYSFKKWGSIVAVGIVVLYAAYRLILTL